MSQYLVDSGQRISADREEAHKGVAHGEVAHGAAGHSPVARDVVVHDVVAHDAGGEGGRAAQREAFGENGHGGRSGSAGHAGERGSTHGGGHGVAAEAGRAGDATLDALDALSDALREMGDDQRLLEERLRELRRQRSEGRAWRDILADEDVPGTMQVVSHMLACLAKASGALRKELVESLRREGASIPAIAKLFGVTHQRVSNLLRRPME